MDHYQILRVKRDASTLEIKRSFRELAKKYHPDVSRFASATETFAVFNTAYQTLSDPTQRAAYDLELAQGTVEPAPPVEVVYPTEVVRSKAPLHSRMRYAAWNASLDAMEGLSKLKAAQAAVLYAASVPVQLFAYLRRALNTPSRRATWAIALTGLVIFGLIDPRLAGAGLALGAGLHEFRNPRRALPTLASFVGRFGFWFFLILTALYSLNQVSLLPDWLNSVILIGTTAWLIYIHPYPRARLAERALTQATTAKGDSK